MNDEVRVEHHFRDPDKSVVRKTLYQFLADQGINQKMLEEMIDRKVKDAVLARVTAIINSQRFDDLIVGAVAHYVQTEKANFERNNYGMHKRLRDLIEGQLKVLLTDGYSVQVVHKAKPGTEVK